MVDTLRADPKTSEEEHFKLILVQTEMERVKFVVRSYVRTRLHKVSDDTARAHKEREADVGRLKSMPIISSSHHNCTSCYPVQSSHTLRGESPALLCSFLCVADPYRYTELLHTHFQHSVLDSLPDWLQRMDDTYGDGLSMGIYPPISYADRC